MDLMEIIMAVIMAALTAVIAGATIAYVRATGRLWESTKQMAEQARDAARDARTHVIWERTTEIWNEWWSDELWHWRAYVFGEFRRKHWRRLVVDESVSLRDMGDLPQDDYYKVRKLAYFFDRVGWLGAEGLIEWRFIFGPMQHSVRYTWWMMRDFAKRARGPLNPVYMLGFEWLYEQARDADHLEGVRQTLRWLPRDMEQNLPDVKRIVEQHQQGYHEELEAERLRR